ncbi:GNAT family N-acetyltransferase [Paenibacillus sp. 2KB_20]|uniref:GNAT family N-acetyltransferase n=1 Tax=Paenibacillus sp. 2KB_20 TaxID=3232977 RepID=UPI003F9A4F08
MINLKEYHEVTLVSNLLAECMWPDNERILQELNMYKVDDARKLFGRLKNNELIGLIGLIHLSTKEVELKHIAIRSDYRRQGIGREMINEYIKKNEINKMIAETHKDAVNFYKNIGFEIMSLGEKYPGVERFQCTLPMNKIM